MIKPVIIAICGKSAAGKDTLAKALAADLRAEKIPTHEIVSLTTRPKRIGEKNGRDYHFIDDFTFQQYIADRDLLEYSRFRRWYYGVHALEIQPDKINIGVFNIQGLKNISKNKEYFIIPVYIEESLMTRLKRSYDREGVFKLEFLRRAITDFFDFWDVEEKIKAINKKYIYLYRSTTVFRRVKIVELKLEKWGIIKLNHY